MSWFGFGGNKDGDNGKSGNDSLYRPAETGFDDHSNDTEFSVPGGAAGRSLGSFEQDMMMEQQKALIQAVMFKLTETAFQKCVTSPSTSLSSSEQSCIKSVTSKYLDTSELIVGRLSGGK